MDDDDEEYFCVAVLYYTYLQLRSRDLDRDPVCIGRKKKKVEL